MNESSAVTREHAQKSAKTLSTAEYLAHAARTSGRGAFDLGREFRRLNKGNAKITIDEYVQYGIYDPRRTPAAERERFISNTLHWPITRQCCDMTWQAMTEDKWMCTQILERAGVPTPKILAVIDKTLRAFPGTPKISTAEELRAFLTAPGAVPVFGKENRGICSFGAFLVEGADDSGVELKGAGTLSHDQLLDAHVGRTPYLLQPVARNHGFFDTYTSSLATVRVVILVTRAGVKIPAAVLKLPSSENVADSFWRAGNLACNLDVATGEVVTIRSKTPLDVIDHDTHPATGAALMGKAVPMWSQLLDLARETAKIFAPIRYQSMDIAVTPEGPMIIEVNTGGGFDLPQLASGKGLLTDEVRAFFHECGIAQI